MLVVTVLFGINPLEYQRFLLEIRENARLSLDLEPGCQRFDVSCAPEQNEVFLYEIYDDEDAFDAHRKMTHYLDFSAITAPWVAEKTVRRFDIEKDQQDG